VLLELVAGKDAGLFETTRSFTNFETRVALGVEVLIGEIAGVEDLLRHVFAMDTHTFIGTPAKGS
jgi:hypothetical protein